KHWFNRAAVTRLAEQIASTWPRFPVDRFVDEASDGLDALELKQRVAHIARALSGALPTDVEQALSIVVACLPPRDASSEEFFDGVVLWPVCHFVRQYAVEHPDAALDAIFVLTRHFTCEFTIRPFIERYPDRVFERLTQWVEHPDPQVRRLVSEGTRPRLPWGQRLTALQHDPSPSVSLLDRLVDDPE